MFVFFVFCSFCFCLHEGSHEEPRKTLYTTPQNSLEPPEMSPNGATFPTAPTRFHWTTVAPLTQQGLKLALTGDAITERLPVFKIVVEKDVLPTPLNLTSCPCARAPTEQMSLGSLFLFPHRATSTAVQGLRPWNRLKDRWAFGLHALCWSATSG